MTGYYPPWIPCNTTKCAYGNCNHERHYNEETDKMRRWCEFHSNLRDTGILENPVLCNVTQVSFR